MPSIFTRALLVILGVSGLSAPLAAQTWYRADTHHFEIYSDGGSRELENFAHEAEKFDALLRMLFNRPAKKNPVRLTIYLLDDTRAVQRLTQSNAAGFYSRRVEQTYAVGSRESQGDRSDLGGKRVLFHEYAHHFMFHNFAFPAPSWFVEGFAEFVATADFKRNGSWTFGEPAHHRAYEVQNGPSIPIERLLSDGYERRAKDDRSSFYGWSWALTHMLYSDPEERGDQIMRYLRDMNTGMSSLEAAEKHFGDLGELEKSLRGYVRRSMAYSKSDKPIPYKDDVSVVKLSDTDSRLIGLRLERLSAADTSGLRAKLSRNAAESNTAAAWLELAELEFFLTHRENSEILREDKDAEVTYDFSASQAALDRALALSPDLPRANILAGRLLLEPFDHDEENADEANWAKARALFLKANRADPNDALALYMYAQSAQREGIEDPMIGPALETAFGFRPEFNDFRSALAMHYANEGEYDRAIGLLKIIANNPHGGKWAERQIGRLENARDGVADLIDLPSPDDEEEEDDEQS